jgi:hypothetical protein
MSASLHALRHKRLVYMKRRERITDAIQRDYAIAAITVRDYARLRRLRDYGDSYTGIRQIDGPIAAETGPIARL